MYIYICTCTRHTHTNTHIHTHTHTHNPQPFNPPTNKPAHTLALDLVFSDRWACRASVTHTRTHTHTHTHTHLTPYSGILRPLSAQGLSEIHALTHILAHYHTHQHLAPSCGILQLISKETHKRPPKRDPQTSTQKRPTNKHTKETHRQAHKRDPQTSTQKRPHERDECILSNWWARRASVKYIHINIFSLTITHTNTLPLHSAFSNWWARRASITPTHPLTHPPTHLGL